MREKTTKDKKRKIWKRMCSLLMACALVVMSGPQQAVAAPAARGYRWQAGGIGDSLG